MYKTSDYLHNDFFLIFGNSLKKIQYYRQYRNCPKLICVFFHFLLLSLGQWLITLPSSLSQWETVLGGHLGCRVIERKDEQQSCWRNWEEGKVWKEDRENAW